MARLISAALYFLFAAFMLREPAIAASADIGIDQHAVFFIRALIYEANTEALPQKTITIAIIHQATSPSAEKLVDIFTAASAHGIKGKSVEIVEIPFSNISDLRERIEQLSVHAVYIDQSANEALSSVLQVTRALQTPSFASSIDMVKRGASLGMHLIDEAPRLAINLRAAQLENIVLPARVLRVSTIIK